MKKIFTLFSVILLIMAQPGNTQTLPAGFSATSIGSGWVAPVGATFTKNGQKLFVWEKGGKVYVCNRNGAGNYIKQANPVLNISEEVGDWRDHGLLGFALDPEFQNNGLIYLLYVVDRHHLMNFGTAGYNAATNEYFAATIGRVTRYQTMTSGSDLVANTATRSILIGETASTGIPILHESHSVGGLAFASDGMLLISAGDGASYNGVDQGSRTDTYFTQALADGIIRANENVGAFRAQLVNCHNGKLLRIDPVTGNGIGSNPFFSIAQPRSPRSRVWAMGFRNPFRIAVIPGTGSANPSTGDIGEVLVGDVGWNLWEELNIIKEPGMNCGWPLYEGHGTMSSYFTLNRTNPDELNPLFGIGGCTQEFFTFNNLLKQATADNNTTVYNTNCNAAAPIGTHNRYFHRRPGIDWRHGQDVARVGIFNGNDARVDTLGKPNSTVIGSSFRGNCAVAGTWYNGDAFPAEYKNTFFQGDLGGQWLKRITIDFTDMVTRVDNFGSGFSNLVCVAQNPLDGTIVTVEISGTGVKKISYGGNMPPVVQMNSDKIFGPSALNVTFTGNSSYDPNGTIASYAWNFGDPSSGNNTSGAANPSHVFSAPAGTPKKFIVKLTVTDNGGATATDSIIISVNNTPPVVNITSPVKNSIYRIGQDTIYTCAATVTDAEHSNGQLQYAWQTILRHNNHEHPETIDTTRNTGTRISRIGCNGDTYYWLIELTVTDAAGLSTKDSSKIFPACSAGPLPLVLRSFSVSQQGNVNLVKWVTENAMQIETFEVERSTDGANFYILDRQDASNTTGINEYSFSDNGFLQGTNYYRLKMIEIGYVAKYSVTVKVSSGTKKEKLVISPNPVVDNFSVKYNAAENGPVIIRISDISGRHVQTLQENVNRGQNIIYLQNMPTWKPGMYLLTIQQGSERQQGKLIKAE